MAYCFCASRGCAPALLAAHIQVSSALLEQAAEAGLAPPSMSPRSTTRQRARVNSMLWCSGREGRHAATCSVLRHALSGEYSMCCRLPVALPPPMRGLCPHPALALEQPAKKPPPAARRVTCKTLAARLQPQTLRVPPRLVRAARRRRRAPSRLCRALPGKARPAVRRWRRQRR